MDSNTAISIKCTIVGDGAVGKTCLATSFNTGIFTDGYVPTIMENYTKHFEVDGKKIKMAVWDTAGQEEFKNYRKMGYNYTDVFLVCFSLFEKNSNASTYDSVQTKWIKEVRDNCPKAQIVLVGTQLDEREKRLKLGTDGDSINHKRKGDMLKDHLNAHSYCECSAMTGEGTEEVFKTAVRAVLEARKLEKTPTCKCCSIS